MEIKLKVNPDAMPNSGISYVDEPVVVESAGGKRVATAILSSLVKHKTKGVITVLDVHLDNLRVINFDLDRGTTITFDDEKGIGEFTTRGQRYRIRALQDFDNYAIQAVESKEDEKD